MPRKVEITVPAPRSDLILERARTLKGVTGVGIQRNGSSDPAADVVTVNATNDGAREVLYMLAEEKILEDGSFSTSELNSLVSPRHTEDLETEGSEQNWEEMGSFLRREVNPTPNFFILMALCGGIAAVGLWVDQVHIVIGAMVISPGFEPLLRIPFGYISGPREHARDGLKGTFFGYLLMTVAAGLTLLVLRVVSPGPPVDLAEHYWVAFWSTITPQGVVVALLAGTAGIMTVTAERPVLTAGVMIALALIPAMSIVGMGVASWDLPLAGAALLRWTVDATAVVFTTTLVMTLKKRILHKRNALG